MALEGSLYLNRNADVATIDSRDTLDDDGSFAPAQPAVSAAAKYLRRVICAAGNPFSAAGQSIVGVRLEGQGLVTGQYDMTFGGYGVQVATGNTRSNHATISPWLNLPCNPGQPIAAVAFYAGSGTNAYEVGITFDFCDTPGPSTGVLTKPKWSRAGENNVTAVDTSTVLSTLGPDTAPNRVLPQDASLITEIQASAGVDHAAAGACVYILDLPATDGWVKGGEHRIEIGASGGQAVQAGADPTGDFFDFTLPDANIAVKGGAAMVLNGEMAGADLGTATISATLYGI